jgi:hypothetical protein
VFRKRISVYCENQIEIINTLSSELLSTEASGTHSLNRVQFRCVCQYLETPCNVAEMQRNITARSRHNYQKSVTAAVFQQREISQCRSCCLDQGFGKFAKQSTYKYAALCSNMIYFIYCQVHYKLLQSTSNMNKKKLITINIYDIYIQKYPTAIFQGCLFALFIWLIRFIKCFTDLINIPRLICLVILLHILYTPRTFPLLFKFGFCNRIS